MAADGKYYVKCCELCSLYYAKEQLRFFRYTTKTMPQMEEVFDPKINNQNYLGELLTNG